MLTLKPTTKFKKDYKRMKKQGKDISLLESVINDLINEKVLDEKYQDHPLVGNYIGFRKCHIQPDWLLIYAINNRKETLPKASWTTEEIWLAIMNQLIYIFCLIYIEVSFFSYTFKILNPYRKFPNYFTHYLFSKYDCPFSYINCEISLILKSRIILRKLLYLHKFKQIH